MLPDFLVGAVTQAMRCLCAGPYSRFCNSLTRPEELQEQLLRTIVRDLARTQYGRYHGITGRESYFDFATKVPIQTYEDLEPWIEQQLSSNDAVVTPHRVVHVEPTSGSSGPLKRIPYTKPLIGSFSNMFSVWAYDQLRSGLKPTTGRMFISISPSTSSGAFVNDDQFLREPLRSLLSMFLVRPACLCPVGFQHRLATKLLSEEKLEIISIWSPSYLLVLLDYIESNKRELSQLLVENRRAILLQDPVSWEQLWPELKLISCWDSALAGPLADHLRRLFPRVRVQGKGLLATEAPVTVPLTEANGCAPLVSDVFLEFETSHSSVKRLHELRQNEQYKLIVSQRAGLSRYRLDDLIEVTGLYRNTPVIKFVGRANDVCDMVGEKLNEQFVRQALSPLIPSGRFRLVPCQENTAHYLLFTDHGIARLAERAEKALCQAHHYLQARGLGQLSELKVLFVPNFLSIVSEFNAAEGIRIGNAKDAALIKDLNKARRLIALLHGEKGTFALPEQRSMAESKTTAPTDQRSTQSLVDT